MPQDVYLLLYKKYLHCNFPNTSFRECNLELPTETATNYFSLTDLLSCRRTMVDERTRQISEKSAEKARQESERMESKKQTSQKICQKERERQEKAETWKHSRIEAMRERRTQHEEMEDSYERAAQEHESQRLVRDDNKKINFPAGIYVLFFAISP